jgi:OOP family OmpA-OmpF porin
MRAKTILFALCVTTFGSTTAAVAQDLLPRDNGIYTYHRAPRYRESESHPLRVFAYMVHPLGWLAREGVFRPLSAFTSSTTFTRSFFGYREPFDHREPECFSSSDAIPDCRQVPPYTNIGGVPGDLVSGGPDEGSLNSGERQVFFPDVNFEFDKAQLNDLGRGRVRQIAQLLASVPSLKVVIEGHTDFMGTDEYNNGLGERRAQAVIGELVELGIDPNRLSPISFGEGKPIFTEEEDWARAVNRRVQFSVGDAAAMPAAATESAS